MTALRREQIASALAAIRAREAAGLAALAKERRADVVRWREVSFDAEIPRPDPWASERDGVEGGAELPEPDAEDVLGDRLFQRLGYDADDRLVLVLRSFFEELHVEQVWFHGDGWIDRIGPPESARFLLDAEGRVVATVGIEHERPQVERWRWDAGVARRGDVAWLGDEHVALFAWDAELDDDGRLVALRRAYRRDDGAPAGDEAAALLAGLDRAAALVPDRILYDARIHRREPRLRETDALVALLAPEIERAVVQAVADCGVPRPFAVEVRPGRDHVVPFVRVGGAAFRDHVRAAVPDRHAALKLLEQATPPDGATVELVDLLGDEALTACRELDWARDNARERASEALEALGAELSARLNGRDWPDAADPFLVLVHLGGLDTPVRPFVRAAETLGKERVQAFRRSIAPDAAAPVPADPPAAAHTDRAALETWLAASGLRTDARRLGHEVARVGLRLDPAPSGSGARSRLGGPGLLVPGAAWPHAEGDRPHTFLAGIDLAELPPTGELPAAGWLLFYADIDDPDGEAAGLIDFSDNAPGAQIHVTHVPPGVEPVETAPPPSLSTVLRAQPVVATARLTLPASWHGTVGWLGLGPAEAAIYDRVAPRFAEVDAGHHWLLGWETGVQGHLPEGEERLLLHLGDDHALDFHFQDAGSIQYRIPAPALAAGAWSAVVAHADSC